MRTIIRMLLSRFPSPATLHLPLCIIVINNNPFPQKVCPIMSELINNHEKDPSQPEEHLKDNSQHSQSVSVDLALDLVPASAGRAEARANEIQFTTGSLTLDQLTAIFSTMPVDLTFVDADDRVRFISEGPDRVFIRPKTIIGRKVQACHPAESLDAVEEIITDFRSGKQDAADFWLNYQGRFVFVRYFALRDDRKQYLGTLEVTQDLTRERSLTGERRLLQYDDTE